WLMATVRTAIIGVLAIVTLVFAWRQWSDARAGRGISYVKLLLLASSISFWWYCNNGVHNILVGIALFEVFHDVQYLSIVWIYNRTRVERDESIRGFMRFVFRRSGSLLGVYVGLVLAYGAIALVSRGISVESIRNSLIGVVTASALLHFYYDGFIWKVRETQTRSMLGIDSSGVSEALVRRRFPVWTAHSLRWAALVIPFSILCAIQLMGRVVPPLERYGKVVELLPNDAVAQLNYGKALQEAGRAQEAVAHFDLALARNPSLAEAEFYLGLAQSDQGNFDQALSHYERALALDPNNVKVQVNLAGILRTKGRGSEARGLYERALARDNNLDIAHKELADLMVEAGEYESALPHYREALRINPDFRPAKENLDFAESLAKH
ncbi:MAG: tetratricopeptide repeat protein, partial [Burkholderiales bacterium]